MKFLAEYRKIHSSFIYLFIAQFFIQLINAAFMQILLIYMDKLGYQDSQSAHFVSFRFLGILLFSVPLGLYIKNHRIKPLFFIASIGIPVFSILIIISIQYRIYWLIYLSQFFWGISLTFIQITILPFILRNSPKEHHVEAFTLSFSTMSLSIIVSGIFIFAFKSIFPTLYDEGLVMKIIAGIGCLNLIFVLLVNIDEKLPNQKSLNSSFLDYDWLLILKALMPIILLGIGSGFTIPFVGLFFFKVHNIDSNHFAILSAFSTCMVFICYLYIPRINKLLGDRISIILTQSIAIILLAVMAFTEPYHHYSVAVFIAVACFVFRQPFMQMAMPLTTNLTMEYVGEKNQEIISALQAAIWSGSWFISTNIFSFFRESGLDFFHIFLITALIYSFGVAWYYSLIIANQKKKLLES